ncbi:hypothetical protein [Paenibacillus campi]|uniref:hypothetical protein n=1 Tax=Paenibacillus campi TaxID=3106031 RepID=UPI002AFF4744|nr:hypothetical protein [Paenibacillus sp. SGZ-1009]
MVQGERISATGILADSNGNYGFDALDGIEEINLIEIDIPLNMTLELEVVILEIAQQIADTFSWLLDERN